MELKDLLSMLMNNMLTVIAMVLIILCCMFVEGYAIVWLVTKLTGHVIDCNVPDYIMIGAIIEVIFKKGFKKWN